LQKIFFVRKKVYIFAEIFLKHKLINSSKMKKYLKFSIAAVFFVALFLNVSISANKKARGTNLTMFTIEAIAGCESNDSSPWMNWGRCSAAGNHCFHSASEKNCDPSMSY